ncbi:hypothetical protein MIND_01265700 [Mycena indigotica]|uniref:LysM domain-containing protein n=1 Tax=Mycena indigotica TaxID=2126181 RepID=A0A8H6S3K8_9AGAR|nr:uncharacterized protein MIND_01265700 [Mycena indigotica]KAF7291222.1 hypothetical protein MIND_01265700 [Mycena indigotica]
MFSQIAVSCVLLPLLRSVAASPLETRQSCSSSYTVVSGDNCWAIEQRTGVSDATLRSLNPSINSGCTNLQVGQVLCLSSGGSTPPGNCGNSYTVVSGDSCWAIEQRTGISDATLHSLNPSINSGCTNLQVGQILCLGSSGGGGGGGGGGQYSGRATYYDPAGGYGACGAPLFKTDFAVAMGAGHWDGGSHCGRSIKVDYQGRSVQVVVRDLCPGCQGTEGIDLTEGAMAVLDPNYIFDGVITVNWSFL